MPWTCALCTFVNCDDTLPSCEVCNTGQNPNPIPQPTYAAYRPGNRSEGLNYGGHQSALNYGGHQSAVEAGPYPGEVVVACDASQYTYGEAGRSACTVICTIASSELLQLPAAETAGALISANFSDWVQRGATCHSRLMMSKGGSEHTSVDDVWTDLVQVNINLKIVPVAFCVTCVVTADPYRCA
jgi:hypothetical protein